MRVLVIGNFTDRRCGFQNFSVQTVTALRRAGVDVMAFDGTYSTVYERQQQGIDAFFPPDVGTYDIVHVIWNALTLNHYSGADWTKCRRTSWWEGGPSDASCPFKAAMQIRWSDYPRDGYHYLWYPVPDWVENLPEPAAEFTVGVSTVRGDGAVLVKAACEAHNWAMNFPEPDQWLSPEDEIRRLAKSTVNVCWYRTPPIWHNRASAPSMLLASGRPLLINDDPLTAHLHERVDLYLMPSAGNPAHDGERVDLALRKLHSRNLILPTATRRDLSWTVATARMLEVWRAA